ncbi:hypothetical protein [Lactobacillus sp. Sy-1]|uniref:hypothetical protein n=1 Tax=Lactobacillus sp. Sy-1 TaxID=2109645 RepID=UPI001C5B79AA|nr:hypothetical protein [Lactobacillus sp. Sy-1]MBW1606253.1 hypothetical protein [Lactobacillus sp. Sy-1]
MNQSHNSMRLRLFALFAGLFIDAYGNSLTIMTNNGNGIWTAVAVEFNQLFNITIPVTLFMFGIANIILNQFLVGHFDWWRIVSGVIYMLFFSYFIDMFNRLNLALGITRVNEWLSLLISVLGIILIGIAISVYQRANILMHPNDDTTNILRFKYFKGSAIKAQFADMGIIAIIIAICSIILRRVDAIGIITVVGFFLLGPVIQVADRIILPNLKHNFSKNDQV